MSLAYWSREDGHRNINSMFSERIHGKSKYKTRPIDIVEATYHADIIMSYMAPSKHTVTLYRGDPNAAAIIDHRREGFISVTSSVSTARAFMDDNCCFYKVIVAPDVRRLCTGVENETLLEPGCLWINIDPGLVRIMSPATSSDVMWYGDVIMADTIVREELLHKNIKLAEDVLKGLRSDPDLMDLGIDVDIELFWTELRRHNIELGRDMISRIYNIICIVICIILKLYV